MKYFYSLLFVLLIQWGANNVSGAPIGNDIKSCIAGDLVQYAYHFECACHPEHVHTKNNECVKKDTLVKCGPADAEGKACGDFAKCVKNESSTKAPKASDAATDTICKCMDGYSTTETTADLLNSCQVNACKDVTCDNGKCIMFSETTSTCSCHIGFIHDTNKKCATKTTNKQECTLTCGTNQECVLQDDKFYKCSCIDGKDPVNGVCGSAFKSTLSTVNALLLVVVLVISLKWA